MPSVSFAALLRALRIRQGLSQEELAQRANLSVRGISDLERGVRRAPHRPTVLAIAEALALNRNEARALEATVSRSRPARAPANAPLSLPRPISSLVARDDVIAEICALFLNRNARLVTLTGPGGVGKTRVAVEASSVIHELWSLRTFFVSLEELHSPSEVIPSLAATLGLRRATNERSLDLIAAGLFGEPTLLVLDSFEHLLDAAAGLTRLLERCPTLRVLTTSRIPLSVRGEHVCAIEPLELPQAPATIEAMAAVASVRLFTERVGEHTPSFAVTEDNAAYVFEIVRGLDGLPLAIELAAAKTRNLSLEEVRKRVREPLRFLSGGLRDLPERQQTIRSAIAWSYELLSSSEQEVLRALGVLRGTWGLGLAQRVVGRPEGQDAGLDLDDDLATLVTRNLLTARIGAETRYRMLQITREFAIDELDRRGELHAANTRLTAAVLELAVASRAGLAGPSLTDSCADLDGEKENIQAALGSCLESGDFDSGARLLWPVRKWFYAGSFGWVTSWLDRALADPRVEDDRSAQSRLLAMRGFLYSLEGRLDHGFDALQASIPMLREIGHDSEFADSVETLIGYHGHRLEDEIIDPLIAQSMSVYTTAGDNSSIADLLVSRAGRNLSHRRLADVEADCRQALATSDSIDPVTYLYASLYLACVRILHEDLRGARKALEPLQPSYPHWLVPMPSILVTTGRVAQRLGDVASAARSYHAALLAAHAAGTLHSLPLALEGAAWLAAQRGRAIEAARLLGATEGLGVTGGGRDPFDLFPDRDELDSEVRRVLGEDGWFAALDAGKRLSLERAIAEGLEELEELYCAGALSLSLTG
jgi:predicted ATPase/DNA-binding XRE family transcriptional regulator